MANYTPSLRQKDQRKKTRLQLRELMDAKVTVSPEEGFHSAGSNNPTESWEGSLRNICGHGVQIVLKADCWGKLRKHQRVNMQFDCSSAKTEATGRLVYIVPARKPTNVILGIEFVEYELDLDAKWAINRICEDAVPCPECKLDENPPL